MKKKKSLLMHIIFLVFASLCFNISAQPYPSKPIKILVGFSPGGVPDIAARVIAQKLTEKWGQAVIVENKLGAGSNIAAQALSTSAADGYTLLSISSLLSVSSLLYIYV